MNPPDQPQLLLLTTKGAERCQLVLFTIKTPDQRQFLRSIGAANYNENKI